MNDTKTAPLLGLAAALLTAACGARTDLDVYPFPDAGSSARPDVAVPPLDAPTASDAQDAQDAPGDVTPLPPPRDAGHDADAPPPPPPPPGPDSGVTQVLLYIPAAPTGAGSTWTWSGSTWVDQNVSDHPPARDATAMAFDGQQIVLFGGLDPENDYLADTWTWNGGSWAEAHPATSPTPRGSFALATLGATVVLFGGVGMAAESTLDDTWVWDGTTWTEAHPPRSPSARSLASVTTVGDKVVLFGGSDATQNSLQDTWLWDGTTWTRADSPLEPAEGYGQASFTLGAGAQPYAVLLEPDFTGNVTDAWTYLGGAWKEQHVPPAPLPALYGFGVTTFDALGTAPVDDGALLYGGYVGSGEAQNHTFSSADGVRWRDLGPSTGPATVASGATPCLMATLAR